MSVSIKQYGSEYCDNLLQSYVSHTLLIKCLLDNLGLANALSIFGPVLGYVFGGGFLFLYVDFEDPEAMDQ